MWGKNAHLRVIVAAVLAIAADTVLVANDFPELLQGGSGGKGVGQGPTDFSNWCNSGAVQFQFTRPYVNVLF